MNEVKFDEKGHFVFMILSLFVWDFVHDYHPQVQTDRLINCLESSKIDNVQILGILEISSAIKNIYESAMRLYGGRAVINNRPLVNYSNIQNKKQEIYGNNVEGREKALLKYENSIMLSRKLTMEVIENNPNIEMFLGNFNFNILSSIEFEYEKKDMDREFRYKQIFTGINKYMNAVKMDKMEHVSDKKKENMKIIQKSIVKLGELFIIMFIDYAMERERVNISQNNTLKISPYTLIFDFLNNGNYKKKIRLILCIVISEYYKLYNSKNYELLKDNEIFTRVKIVSNSLDKIAGKIRSSKGGSEDGCKSISENMENIKSEMTKDEPNIDEILTGARYITDSIQADPGKYGIITVSEMRKASIKINEGIVSIRGRMNRRGFKYDSIRQLVLNMQKDLNTIYKLTNCKGVEDELKRIAKRAQEGLSDLPNEAQIYVSHIHRMIGKKILIEMGLIEKIENTKKYRIIETYDNLYVDFIVHVIATLSRLTLENSSEKIRNVSSNNSNISYSKILSNKFRNLMALSSRDVDGEIFKKYKMIIDDDENANIVFNENSEKLDILNKGDNIKKFVINNASDGQSIFKMLNGLNKNYSKEQYGKYTFCPDSSIMDAMKASCPSNNNSKSIRETGSMKFKLMHNNEELKYDLKKNGDNLKIKIDTPVKINDEKYDVDIVVDVFDKMKRLQADMVYKYVVNQLIRQINIISSDRKNLERFLNEKETKGNNFWDKFANYTSIDKKINPMLSIMRLTCIKSFGDWFQEVNGVIENGGYDLSNYNITSTKIISHKKEKNALRLVVSNDRPSAVRIYHMLTFGKSGINENAYGGYLPAKPSGGVVKDFKGAIIMGKGKNIEKNKLSKLSISEQYKSISQKYNNQRKRGREDNENNINNINQIAKITRRGGRKNIKTRKNRKTRKK